MKRQRRLPSLISAVIAAMSLGLHTAVAKVHLKIAADAALMDTFEDWTAGQSWDQIKDFKNANAVRPVLDLVLELQALKAGGLDFDFEFVRTIGYDLATKEVFEGRADLQAETLWDADIALHAQTVLKTDPIIREGEFLKGIYVLPTRADLLKISSIDELRDHVGAVVGGWVVDAQTIEDMKLRATIKVLVPAIAFARIREGKADFTLMEFSAKPDMSIELGGVRLVPVPNCTVGLAGSRSWIVPKSSASAQEIYRALTAGIETLRANGTIDRAYKESGFFNPRVVGWKRIF